MALKLAVFYLNAVLLYFVHCNPHENTLNVPQVLLPYAIKGSPATTFLLKAYKGCLKWSSTKPNVASIELIHEKSNATFEDDQSTCSQSALVTVKLKTPEEDTTVILAEEEGSGLILRCDVFVDSIHKVEITTTTQELLLGESPEVFDVYGYDKEGNLFTTLASQTFDWQFLPAPGSKKVDPRTILKLLWFCDSSYDTTAEIYALEERHNRGCSALVEGINTGEAIVSAKLSNPEYKDVPVSSVKLTVIDNVMLHPALSFIFVGQKITYSVVQLRRGRRKYITLPSQQYTVKILDPSIGELNGAVVGGLHVGKTNVQLVDNNMADISSLRPPTAMLYVVDPGRIGFSINSGKVWVLEVGKVYELCVLLFTDDDNRIEIARNTIIESALSTEYFEVFNKSANGSYYHVRAKKIGVTTLSGKLLGVEDEETHKILPMKHIYGEQSIEIHNPISVLPKTVVFPWVPGADSTYQYELKAVGGSGNYIWETLNKKVAAITRKGLVTVGGEVGVATVKVKDARNTLHYALAMVRLSEPKEIMFVEGKVEVLVGETLDLQLAVFGEDSNAKTRFADCRKMPVKYTFSDSIVFEMSDFQQNALPPDGCKWVVVRGTHQGHATLTATYTYADVILRASIVIAAYTPVSIIDPLEVAVVTLGGTKGLLATGGPIPWVLDTSGYYKLISAEEEDWVLVGENKMSTFDVTCTQIGEQILTVEVGNKPTSKNKFPAKSSTTTKFCCAPPVTMTLSPLVVLPTIDGKTETIESCKDELKRFPVRNRQDLRINIMFYDANGQPFDDATSLDVDVVLDNYKAATVGEQTTLHIDHHGNKNGRGQTLQTLHLLSEVAPLVVTATATSYKHTKVKLQNPISAKLHLHLVSKPAISPQQLTMFAHASSQVKLSVIGGTGHFVVKSNKAKLALVDLVPTHMIQVVPQQEGKLVLYLHDTCLEADKPSEGHILLSDVYALQLHVADKVELANRLNATCLALDINGDILGTADISNKLQLHLKSSNANIFAIETASSLYGSHFTLIANTVGISSLTCQASKLDSTIITSKASEVQVFSSIVLQPKHLLLVVGSVFQVEHRGGPRPHSTCSFTLTNKTVADVTHNGLVTAQTVGVATLTGSAVGVDSTTGDKIVYSKDATIITVVKMKGFKISLSSRHLVTGTEVGVLCVGLTDEGPFTFATALPYLRFHWSTSNHKVVVIESPHYQAGVAVNDDRDFRVLLRTLAVGQATIKLRVEVFDHRQVSEFAQLEDDVHIEVFEKLTLLYPSSHGLLLPPNTHTYIKTNRDPLPANSYEIVHTCSQKDSVIGLSGDGRIATSSTVGSVEVKVTSRETFSFNQSLVLRVEVKPISTITLQILTKFAVVNGDRPSFPIGLIVLLGVVLHDDVGRCFDVANVPLDYRTSRLDVIHVEENTSNRTYALRTTSIGEAVVKVWSEDSPVISDYLRMRVTHGILPNQITMSLGEAVCFKANLRASSSMGWWSASGAEVEVDRDTGVVVGVAAGSTILYYNEPTFSTHTEVTVVYPPSSPIIASDEDFFIISNTYTRAFAISSVGGTLDHACTHPPINTTVLTCNADWADGSSEGVALHRLFNLTAVYESCAGKCVFAPLSLPPDILKSVSVEERAVTLRAVLSDGRRTFHSKEINVRFTPQVLIETKHVMFDKQNVNRVIEVHGSPEQLASLQVTCVPSLLYISRLSSKELTVSRYQFSLPSSSALNANVSLVFESKLLQSSVIVMATVNSGDGGACAPHGWSFSADALGTSSTWVVAYTVMLATVVLLILMYHYVIKDRVVVATYGSPYATSPPPYQYSPPFQTRTPGSYGPSKKTTPQRTLFSVSQ